MKKNKNKTRKKKILIALLMLLFTGVILTASTYAWFTSNDTLRINDVEVEVTSSTGLQMSADGSAWKPVLKAEDFKNATAVGGTYAAGVTQIPDDGVSPVSSAGEVFTNDTGDAKKGWLKMFKGEVKSSNSGDYILTSTNSIEKEDNSGDFIAFDVFFKSSNVQKVYLSHESEVILDTSDPSKPEGIQNAARVAFVVEGNTAETDLNSIQGLATDSSNDVFFWEPNSNSHTDGGIQNARDVYGLGISADHATLSYYGVKDTFDDTVGVPLKYNSTYATHFRNMGDFATGHYLTSSSSGIPESTYLEVFTLQPGITKVRIYMWIEGQDVDCENTASGASVIFKLQFSINSSNPVSPSPSPAP